MLEGKLSEEEHERWSWDRELGKAKREVPRELSSIKGYHDPESASSGLVSQAKAIFRMMTPGW